MAALWVWRILGLSWGVFALFFFAPDLSIIGYVVGKRFGAVAYNLCHTQLAPALAIVAGYELSAPAFYAASAIWIAHIGFDRLAGFGLKYSTDFKATHFGWLGRSG